MHKNFLFEIGTEELPFSAQQVVLREAKNLLNFSDVEIFVTPTRIVVLVKNLPVIQFGKNEIVDGPPKKIAYNEKNEPTPALLGFLKKMNISLDEIKEKETEKGVYLYAEKIGQNIETAKILPEICLDFVRKLPFAKMMTWNATNFKFIRPIRWVLAIFDDELIDFEIAGVKTQKATFGIGGFRGEKREVKNIEDYFAKFDDVILNYEERKQIIKNAVKKCGKLVEEDEDLLDEVTALVEYPTAVLCDFSPKFLSLPEPVIYTVLKNHQKCFALCDESGKFVPQFVAVCNGQNRNLALVKEGYEKVAVARLNDAMFFYEKDQEIPLRDRTEVLKTLVYQDELGSVYDKLERMKKIANKIGNVDRVINLSKNDLLTGMVGEFPELQGIMGKFYAQATGDADIAQAIEDHYLPKFVGDKLPETLEGEIASIDYKIDNISSTFKLGKKPTGSKDPFGIRRQIYGIFNILEARDMNIEIHDLTIDVPDLRVYLNERLENWLIEKGIRIDVARSVISDKEKCQPVEALKKAKMIMNQINEPNFLTVIELYKRANNILKKSGFTDAKLQENLLGKEEKDLLTAIKNIQAFENFASVKDSLHNFFENVMVMDEDETKRNNRLFILNLLVERFKTFADFSEIN